ncbi:helix-turn-helix domain-containing protein [Enterococcus sp. LJL99]
MKQYGKTFKFIRKNKSLSQEIVAHQIMSRSNLSRFEQGTYAVSYVVFIQLLQRLDMLYEEFIYIHNNYQLSKKDQLYATLVSAETKEELAKVNAISQHAQQELAKGNLEYELLFFTAQTALYQKKEPSQLTRDEMKNYLQKKLIETDTWFLNDFRVLNNFLTFLENEEIDYFVGRAVKEFSKYEQILVRNNVYVHLLLNAGTIFFKRQDFEKARIYLLATKQCAVKQNKLLQVLLAECYLYSIDIYEKKEAQIAKKECATRLDLLCSWGYSTLVDELKRILIQNQGEVGTKAVSSEK